MLTSLQAILYINHVGQNIQLCPWEARFVCPYKTELGQNFEGKDSPFRRGGPVKLPAHPRLHFIEVKIDAL